MAMANGTDEEDLLSVANGLEEEEPEEDEEDDPPPAAEAPAGKPAFVTRPRRRRGASRKVDRTSHQGLAEPVAPSIPNDGTKNIAVIWTDLVDWLLANGHSPDQVSVHVKRYAIGANRNMVNAVQDKGQIDGGTIAGIAGVMTPGESIVDYVMNVWHKHQTIPSAARYVFGFNFKSGSNIGIRAPQGELILGDPKEIEREEAAKKAVAARLQQAAYERAMSGGLPGALPPLPMNYVRSGFSPGMGYVDQPRMMPPLASDTPAPVAAPPPPPPVTQFVGASPELEALRQRVEDQRVENAKLEGLYSERARQEGLRPMQPPAPVETPEQQAQRIAAVVAQTLAGMGFTPALAQQLQNPAPARLTQPQVASVSDPLAAVKSFFTTMREFRKIDQEMTEMFTPDEPDEPELPPTPAAPVLPQAPVAVKVEDDPYAMRTTQLVPGLNFSNRTKKPDEPWLDYAVDMARANPTLSMRVANAIQNVPAIKNAISASPIGSMIAKTQEIAGQVVEQVIDPKPPAPSAPPPPGAPAGGGFTPR